MLRLTQIKIVHTIIWVLFNMVLFYLLYAVINNKLGIFVWLGIGVIILEGFVLLIFKNQCPLTIMARKYSDSTKANFDIYLPEWLARYNKWIYGSMFIVIILLLVYRLAST